MEPSGSDFVTVAVVAASVLVAPVSAVAAPQVILQPGTSGCTGVLPSNDGNTDMRLVGGTMYPGGTAIFEISYPVNAGNVGKEFTILDCAYINDVAALKYTVSFVPSNQFFVLSLTLAVPIDAPVGGQYCNYVKTTGSPTASQGSQRKAGPACFIIRPPPGATFHDSRRSDLASDRRRAPRAGRRRHRISQSCFRTPRCPRTRNPSIG